MKRREGLEGLLPPALPAGPDAPPLAESLSAIQLVVMNLKVSVLTPL